MLELQVDSVVFSYFTADVLDVAVCEFPDPAVSAAQQILVQIENRDVEDLVQLFFQAARVRGYPESSWLEISASLLRLRRT